MVNFYQNNPDQKHQATLWGKLSSRIEQKLYRAITHASGAICKKWPVNVGENGVFP